MRIGYCSPFKPMRSGISDFSEELIMALREYMEIIIFSPIEPENSQIKDNFEWFPISTLDDSALRSTLDLIVYHTGNNMKYHGEITDMLMKYPGVVEIHDFAMHHLAAEKVYLGEGGNAYLKLATYCHGKRGAEIAKMFLRGEASPPWETHAMDMSMNRYIIEKANAVVVHSDTIKQMVLGLQPEMPIANIHLHADIVEDIDKNRRRCREALGLPQEQLIMGSFGFATSAKRIVPILDALKLYRQESSSFLYVVVGAAEKEMNLTRQISSRGLGKNVLVTGFTDLTAFKNYMGSCDFCLNLRYPTRGESSATLHRMLGMGKPVVLTNIGTFRDYPDDIVIKVRHDEHEVSDIYHAIRTLILNRGEVTKRGIAARDFAAKYCSLPENAKRYSEFFEAVVHHSWQPEYEDIIIGRLCELGLTEEAYVTHIFHKCVAML